MFKKRLLAIAVLASLSGAMPLAFADEPQAPALTQPTDAQPVDAQPVDTAPAVVDDAQSMDLVDKRWYVAPFGTYFHGAGARATSDGWGGGIGVGKMIDKHFNVELRGFYYVTENYHNMATGSKAGNWGFGGGTADLQYYFTRGKFAPYTVVALGAMNTSVPGNSASGAVGFIGQVGAGFTYEVHDNFLIRADARYQYNNNFGADLRGGNNQYNDLLVNLGFVVPIGAKPKAAEPIPAAPIAAAPDCSTQDTDADGVNNCNDKCEGTINGTKVDIAGCPVVLVLRGVNFRYDSAVLTANAQAILDDVAKGLITFPLKDEIEVRGYTSSEGTLKHNQKLSERRSQSVVDYLKMKGVPNRMHAVGFGPRDPIADNSTEAGREQNRRVELRWMDHQ